MPNYEWLDHGITNYGSGWSKDVINQCFESGSFKGNRFKGNVGETSERRGGAHMGFSGRIDTILN